MYYVFKLILLILFTFFVLYSCSPEKSNPTGSNSEPVSYNVEPEAVEWLKSNANSIYTESPGEDYSDLMDLKEMIGDAKIVALGEPSYGTHECTRLKNRILEFLAEEMNFNIFTIEAAYLESGIVNDFVQTGVGDPENLLFWLVWWQYYPEFNNLYWLSQEMLDLLIWMRNYNRSSLSNNNLLFTGFDVERPQRAMELVLEYFMNTDSTLTPYISGLYFAFQNNCTRYPIVGSYIKKLCRSNCRTVLDTLQSLRDRLISLSSEDQYNQAKFYAELVLKAEQVLRGNNQPVHDTYLVEMILHILEQRGSQSKIVLWSHNERIGYFPGNLGNRLKTELGDDFLNIGLSFYEGYFNAMRINPEDGSYSFPCLFAATPPPSESYEEYFSSIGLQMFYFDPQLNLEPPGSAATDWLYGPRKLRQIFMFFDPDDSDNYFPSVSLKNSFDVMVFIQNTIQSEFLLY